VTHDFALQPYRVRDRGQQRDENNQRLDRRHQYENANGQGSRFLSQFPKLLNCDQSAATSAGLVS
jgi:hypothetical protein